MRLGRDAGLLVFEMNANIIKVAGTHTAQFGGDEPYCQALS